MATLEALHLVKHYKTRKVVNDFSLALNSGEIVGLLGPNGAGKTTCFYMIVGLVSSDSGYVKLDEKDITYYSMHKRARLGISYLPQEPSVFRKLTVHENILAILQLRKELTKSQQQQKANDLLEEFHLTPIQYSLGISLSGGERRRLEIARALAGEPKFILLDEPFAGVDPISIIDIKRLITHLKNKNIGVLITDHNVRETLAICERAYIVNEGANICEGAPQTILNNQKVRQIYLGEDFYI